MDYSGKTLMSSEQYLNNFIFFNDDICEKYLRISASSLEIMLDKQKQFNDLSCDLVDGDIMICAPNEKSLLKLLQFIADTFTYEDPRLFFIECNVENRLIKKIDFINESAKILSLKESKELNEMIDNWKDELCDFLIANWEWIEYCDPEREVSFEDCICNYIKFPKAENGKQLADFKLQEIIDTIQASDLNDKFFGQFTKRVNIIDRHDAKYIIWNCADVEAYDNFTIDIINKLYRY